jgi:hypothetical protein
VEGRHDSAAGSAGVALLDRTTRALTTLARVPVTRGDVSARFAFSPDGTRVAFSVAGTLRLVDDRGTTQWTVSLPDGYRLAGGGAFTPDGRRIALVHALPCHEPCAGARPWAVTYVDSTDGAAVSGPSLPTIMAAQIRAVGWSPARDGERSGLVVVRYLPHPAQTPTYAGPTGGTAAAPTRNPAPAEVAEPGPADLYELVPGEQPQLLLDAPFEVTDLDVAVDLVAAGRLEGPPSTPSLLPIEADRVRLVDVARGLAVLGGLVAVVAVLAARRRGQTSTTFGTIIGRRRYRSLTQRPIVRRTTC